MQGQPVRNFRNLARKKDMRMSSRLVRLKDSGRPSPEGDNPKWVGQRDKSMRKIFTAIFLRAADINIFLGFIRFTPGSPEGYG